MSSEFFDSTFELGCADSERSVKKDLRKLGRATKENQLKDVMNLVS